MVTDLFVIHSDLTRQEDNIPQHSNNQTVDGHFKSDRSKLVLNVKLCSTNTFEFKKLRSKLVHCGTCAKIVVASGM